MAEIPQQTLFSSGGGGISFYHHESLNSDSIARYMGLIRPSYFKIFRKDLSQLFGYIYSIVSSFSVLHKIMTFFRIVQFLGPSLMNCFFNFWVKGEIQEITVDVLSFFFHITPGSTQDRVGFIFIYIYIGLKVFLSILLLSSVIYFKKYAKLPNFLTAYIVFDFTIFGYFLHPIALNDIFYILGKVVSGKFDGSIVEFSTDFCIVIIISIIHFWIVINITSKSLVFSPDSLMSVTSSPSNFIFIVTSFINILVGFASPLSKLPQAIILAIVFVLYAVSSFSVFQSGGFIEFSNSVFILASSITGAGFTLLVFVCIILEKKAELEFFFAFLALFIVASIVSYFVLRQFQLHALRLLDIFPEDMDKFCELFKTSNQFLNICVIGFSYAHPVCCDMSVFDLAIERWKDKPGILFTFAKFIAIYPEETQKLDWVSHNVSILKLSGPLIRCMKEQILVIARQRESTFSRQLKSKLNIIANQVESAKHRLRHVWDVVIQSNIGEIEVSAKRAIKEIKQMDADFKHLLRQYPNNRSVIKTYANFLDEIEADYVAASEMNERAKKRKYGPILEHHDRTHEFGLSTFKLLPQHIKPDRPLDNQTTESTNEGGTYSLPDTSSDTTTERRSREDLDQLTTLRTRIENLTIPAIRCSQIVNIVFFVVLIFIPCVFGLIYVQFFRDSLIGPLDYMSTLALLRSYSYQMVGFSLRLIGETLSILPIIENITEKPPTNFGNTWNTLEQLQFVVASAGNAIQDFGSFRQFRQNDFNIGKAQELGFSNTLSYRYYINTTEYTSTTISLQAALMDFIIQQNTLMSFKAINDTIDPGIINTSVVLNPCFNAFQVTNNINYAMQYLTNYINQVYDNTEQILLICLISIIIFIGLVFVITLIMELNMIKKNKQEAYQCIFALPKNTVSRLGNFSGTSNNGGEISKQEENLLKIFNTSTSFENPLSDIFTLVICTILIVGLTIGCIIVFDSLISYENNCLKESAPHLNYLLGSYSMAISTFCNIFQLLFYFTPYKISAYTPDELLQIIELRIANTHNFFLMASFGDSAENQPAYSGFDEGVANAEAQKSHFLNTSTIPRTMYESFLQYPVDLMFTAYEPIFHYLLAPYQQGKSDTINSSDEHWTVLWYALISPIYDKFFYPLHFTIIETIGDNLANGEGTKKFAISFMLILVFFVEAAIFIQLRMIEQHIRSVLCLILHCPSKDILGTPKIMKLLSGDFSTQRSDSMDRDSDFFDSVFLYHPNAMMYANMSDMIIVARNQSCQRYFGENIYSSLIGSSMKDFFFNSNYFIGQADQLFSDDNITVNKSLIFKKEDGTEINLEVTSMPANGMLVIICKDVTQNAIYDKLIREERGKCDQILAQILPPTLAKRMQEGEKNIAFSVQKVSVLFLNIIGFNSWCKDLPSSNVMSILNMVYGRFDQLLAQKPTLTKMKVMGDCYMVAGAFFADVPQQAEHEKEALAFGLESIKTVTEINKEQKLNLSIRVGLDAGGPVVAGVLDVGKPTFELFGNVVSIAKQIEEKCIPMTVHISRAVFERIYFDFTNYKIHTREKIAIKQGTITSYTVLP